MVMAMPSAPMPASVVVVERMPGRVMPVAVPGAVVMVIATTVVMAVPPEIKVERPPLKVLRSGGRGVENC